MADLAGMRQKFFATQRQNIDQDAARRGQEADDMIKRRFAALGQAGSGAQIGTTLKAQNENAGLHQRAVGDLAGQQIQSEMQSAEIKEARDFDAGLKREFFNKEQENIAKQMDLAERQFAFDKDTTEFNKRMAEQEAGRKPPGLLDGLGIPGISSPGDVVKKQIAPGIPNPVNIVTGGGCFLTTAACEVMGLADDSWVLESARAFRDSYMAQDEDRAKEIVEYYEIAPSVAAKISERADAKKVWKSLFWKNIIPFVLASRVSSELAHELYKKLIAKAKELAGVN